jgi:hypothetical protein
MEVHKIHIGLKARSMSQKVINGPGLVIDNVWSMTLYEG